MEFFLILIVAVIGLVIYLIFLNKKRTTVVVDENSFSQHGVRVDFSAGTITIKEHTYPVNKVTGINTVYDRRSGGIVSIEVDDFIKPIHKVVFGGTIGENQSKDFAQRLSIALRKAGGPSFV